MKRYFKIILSCIILSILIGCVNGSLDDQNEAKSTIDLMKQAFECTRMNLQESLESPDSSEVGNSLDIKNIEIFEEPEDGHIEDSDSSTDLMLQDTADSQINMHESSVQPELDGAEIGTEIEIILNFESEFSI